MSLHQSNKNRKSDAWIKQELQDARRSLNDATALHQNEKRFLSWSNFKRILWSISRGESSYWDG